MGKPKKTVFKCKHCPKEFKKHGNFENHMKCHKMPKAFKCAQCEVLFTSASELEDHIRYEHLKPEVLDCNECGKTFVDEASFKIHVCKQVTQAPFTCDKCTKSFKFLRNLKNHQRVHVQQKNEDLHSCQSCPKMFATDAALKKHGLNHDIELNYSSSFEKSDIQKKNSKIVKQSARKSMRATRTYWCHLCNCGFNDIQKFKMHIIKRHQRSKSNESDTDSKKAHTKSSLPSSMSVEKRTSSTKYKIVKQEKNSKNQNIMFAAEKQQTKKNIKTEPATESSQQQSIFFDDNQVTVGLPQSHLGGMYNNFVQPVQQPSNGFINFGNAPNMQLISIPPSHNAQQNDLENVPKFDFYSGKYMRWLKKFISKCECQTHPFPLILAKKIGKVNNDIFNALIGMELLKNKKEDHFYLMNIHKSLGNIMYNHVKYTLTHK